MQRPCHYPGPQLPPDHQKFLFLFLLFMLAAHYFRARQKSFDDSIFEKKKVSYARPGLEQNSKIIMQKKSDRREIEIQVEENFFTIKLFAVAQSSRIFLRSPREM